MIACKFGYGFGYVPKDMSLHVYRRASGLIQLEETLILATGQVTRRDELYPTLILDVLVVSFK